MLVSYINTLFMCVDSNIERQGRVTSRQRGVEGVETIQQGFLLNLQYILPVTNRSSICEVPSV